MSINLLSSDEEQIAYAKAKGFDVHEYKGPADNADCEICGLNFYWAIHTDRWPNFMRDGFKGDGDSHESD